MRALAWAVVALLVIGLAFIIVPAIVRQVMNIGTKPPKDPPNQT